MGVVGRGWGRAPVKNGHRNPGIPARIPEFA